MFRLWFMMLWAVSLLFRQTMAFAADPQAVTAHQFTIPSEPLEKAVSDFSKAMDVEVLVDPALVSGKSSTGINGVFNPREGLRALLAGSCLEFDWRDGFVTLYRGEAPPRAVSARRESRVGQPEEISTVIVPGTRDIGVTASESLAPVEIISGEALSATGQNRLFDALRSVVPSVFSVTGIDYGVFLSSLRLRGMPAGETLVLINGKRRHVSANMDTITNEDFGSNPVDLDQIPLGMIDHVEMGMIDHVELLLDGASALYGSDAIAGVVNIILKKADHGMTLSTTGGITSRGDGAQGEFEGNAGFALGHGGFVNVTAGYTHHDFSTRDQGIPAAYASSLAFGRNGTSKIYNRYYGDPLVDQGKFGYNLEVPVTLGGTDATLYAFGTAGYRAGQAYENFRRPSVAPQRWSEGFFPRETVGDVDFGITEGLKGTLWGWNWDFSNTFGRDEFNQGIFNTYNTGYFAVSGTSPTKVNTGALVASQSTTNFDVSRPLDVGFWQSPVTLSIGLEHRFETYQEIAGDPLSYLYGGTEAFQGYSRESASNNSRSVLSGYVDLSTEILPRWRVDLAGRFADYSDFGSASTGRLSTRYDVASWLGVRGTIANGFHAPTMAQEHFGYINASPSDNGPDQLTLQVPPSAAYAKSFGVLPLRPETSDSASLGIIGKLTNAVHANIDVYQIFLDNRVYEINPPSTSSDVTYSALYNAVGTRTRGVDIGVDYLQDLDSYGILDWKLAGNQNNVSVTRVNPVVMSLNAGDPAGFVRAVVDDVAKTHPENKITLALNLLNGPWDILLRETRWGHYLGTEAGRRTVAAPSYLTDVAASYAISGSLKLTIGGNNVFDAMPPYNPKAARSARNSPTYVYSPYGFDGAYFFSRLTATF